MQNIQVASAQSVLWRSALRLLSVFALILVVWTAVPAVAQQEHSDRSSAERSPRSNLSPRDGSSQEADFVADASDLSETTGGATAPSAQRIVRVLRQEPELLDSAKALIAQDTSADPSTISDELVYARLRQDASLRARITQELDSRGYSIDEMLSDENDGDDSDGRQQGAFSARRVSNYPSDIDSDILRREDPSRSNNVKESTRSRREYADNPRGLDEDDTSERASTPRRRSESSRDEQNLRNLDRNAPQVSRRPNPYKAIPSLRDLYVQVPSTQQPLKRFGSDTFRLGTGNSKDLPMDLPAGPDYVLGPGDSIVLSIWGLPHFEGLSTMPQRLPRTVDRQGQVAVPEVGTINVTGQTIAQARDTVAKVLGTQFSNIKVDLSLGRVRTVRVYVVGDVQRPGAYDVSSLSTTLNALYTAGGPTSRGSLRLLKHYRGKDLVREVDLYDFLLNGVSSDVERLLPGDTLLVPPVGPQISVSGMVRRPAVYELKGNQTLKEILDLAGGLMVSASLRQVNVERIEAHERRTSLSVQLPDRGNQDEAVKTLVGFHVQDGDYVRVLPILPYNEKTVYLDGHVFRPGKYAYRDGMKVGDLLRSYQDVMPEPANHAEIIRLQSPDFRPTTIEFNLSDVLSGDDPILLQPFDVVRVFSRYEIDPPRVKIQGEVLRPGEYPLSQDMTVSRLIQMAGGFRRSAYRQTADLTSYLVQNGSKVLSKVTTVDLAKAMEGDKSADALLKPGDVVGIRQLSGWSDIGAGIKISGEVAYPGTYGIAAGERLSAVLRRAGGFRSTAYPEGAVLDRIQVREMGEKTRQELIRRIETTSSNVSAGMNTGQEQLALVQAMQAQQQQTLAALRSHSASGRLVIRISSDVSKWENTAADIEIRAGDRLVIPKRPSFVLVSGQVYNPSALTYVPGKTAGWYLRQAGGSNSGANKKGIYVLRADGSVVGVGSGLFSAGALSVRLRPGDAVIVPEKVVGGSMFWRNMMTTAQTVSSIATTAALAAASM